MKRQQRLAKIVDLAAYRARKQGKKTTLKDMLRRRKQARLEPWYGPEGDTES